MLDDEWIDGRTRATRAALLNGTLRYGELHPPQREALLFLARITTERAVQEAITRHRSTHLRLELANNPNCPSDLLESLVRQGNTAIKQAVLTHPNAPPYIKGIGVLGQ